MKYYTGVGSRQTPQNIKSIIYRLACRLEKSGWTVRTGDADGADAVFREVSSVHIFTPFDAKPNAIKLASKFHPAWNRCSRFARKLHGRNAYQVLGGNLRTPSSFVICWTPDGAISHKNRSINTGGTGTAISIASHYNIPVFNLFNSNHLNRILAFLDSPEQELDTDKPISAKLLQITAPHFVAGLELKNRPNFNVCAPIINYMKTWDWQRIRNYTAQKGWKLSKIS